MVKDTNIVINITSRKLIIGLFSIVATIGSASFAIINKFDSKFSDQSTTLQRYMIKNDTRVGYLYGRLGISVDEPENVEEMYNTGSKQGSSIK